MLSSWWDDWGGPGLLLWLGIAAVVALIPVLIYAGIQDDRHWQTFRAEHHCKIVAHINGDVFNTFGVSAKGTAVVGVAATPDKTGWKCDDGVTYYR